ncbi:MAG: TRAP transporter large permease subunit [Clostridiales Family XIII bacterium]|nr:TRAP transporter large permease subunit [Clostridiales Family XIII bacterium]
MTPEVLTILMFVGVLAGVFLGFPIAFTLAGLGVIFGLVGWGTSIFNLLGATAFGLMSTYTYAAIPLFVFMGCMLETSGIADKAFDILNYWTRKVKGGIAIASIILCTIFAACTGIVGASVTTMGLLALPAMIKRGYHKGLACGVIGAGGCLGILIPPSNMLVLYGPIANVSIVSLFSAAILPGLLLAGIYLVYVILTSRIKPLWYPPILPDTDDTERFTLLDGAKAFVPFIILILAVLGAILFGLAAPTEAAALGAFGSILIAYASKRLTLAKIKAAALSTLQITSMVIFIALGANLFTSVFFLIGGGTVVANFMESLGLGAVGSLILVLLIVFLLGMLIDWLGILLIVVPIFTPVLYSFGFDPIWIALLIVVVMQTSFLTPPFAYALFYIKAIAPPEVTLGDIYRGVIPFICLQLIGLVLCIAFPNIILWLPNLLASL